MPEPNELDNAPETQPSPDQVSPSPDEAPAAAPVTESAPEAPDEDAGREVATEEPEEPEEPPVSHEEPVGEEPHEEPHEEPVPEETAEEAPAEQEHESEEHIALAADAAEWGYVDDEGNVHYRGGQEIEAKVVGKMRGQNPAAALGFFAAQFKRLLARVEILERDAAAKEDKSRFAPRVESLLAAVRKADAVGDFDALLARLSGLEEQIREHLQANVARKEELVTKAQELAESNAWKATAETFKALQTEWKAVGPVPKDLAEGIWQTFRGAANRFFERRKEHYAELEEQLLENLEKKDALCVRAEEITESTNWKETAEAFKALQEEWRAIGPVPRAKSDAVWQRFRGAANHFFERRKEHYRDLERDQKENLRRKEALCVQAEELARSSEWRATVQAIKTLQAEWKAVGPVPKSRSEAVWARFRGAIDQFFARQAVYFDERNHRHGERREQLEEALSRKREQADRLRDSIARDDENLERWRSNLADVHPSADDIRTNLETKIADVESRKSDKASRLAELDSAIRDIEEKLVPKAPEEAPQDTAPRAEAVAAEGEEAPAAGGEAEGEGGEKG